MQRRKTDERQNRWCWIAPAIVLACGLIAYSTSLHGPFLFDDVDAIQDNPDFGGMAPGRSPSLFPHQNRTELPTSTTFTARPILWLSFRLDYLVAGQNVEPYHATNILIHLAAALLLYAILLRNLTDSWQDRFKHSAPWLAATIAAIWVVHPLNTEAVTYIGQRAESLASLFYLAVIYCLSRSAAARRTSSAWDIAAIAACLLGELTKEMAATAPVLALIYDRTFLAGSFKRAIQLRWRLYAGLFSSWLLLAFLIVQGGGRGHSVGFGVISVFDYARTQLGAIAHYLHLAVWPDRSQMLLMPAGWAIARRWSDIGLGGVLVILLVLLSLISFWKKPRLGFVGAWYFLILAPSSSIVPVITEVVAERRTYLSIIALIALFVVVGWMLAQRFRAPALAIAVAACVVIALTAGTLARNNDYQSMVQLSRQAVALRPGLYMSHYNLAYALAETDWSAPRGSPQAQQAAKEAAQEFRIALHIKPDYEPAASLLGRVLIESGDSTAAEQFYDGLIANQPTLIPWEAHLMRGTLRANRNDFPAAQADLQTAVSLRPDNANGHFLLGMTDESLHQNKDAETQFQQALQLDPDNRQAADELEHLRTGTGG